MCLSEIKTNWYLQQHVSFFSAFTCDEGQYINIQADQECHSCPAGTYSLGGGVRFEDWDHLPSGFSIQTEDLADDSYHRNKMRGDDGDHKTANCTA